MNLKNINKFFVVCIIFLFVSCSKIELINKEKTYNVTNGIDEIEKVDFIKEGRLTKFEFNDFYSRNSNFKWKDSHKLKKIYQINFNKNEKKSPNLSNILISNDIVYFINSETKFTKLDLFDGNKIFEIGLDNEFDKHLVLPTSIVKIDEYFIVSFGNGKIMKIDDNGNKYWEKDFNDLLRTPLKKYNNNIIVLLNSNKIFLLNSKDGSIIWEYSYELDKPSSSKGGQLLSKNNIIFFVMPNGRIGSINSIVGDQIDYEFLSNLVQKNILNYNYEFKFHIYENLFSFIENNKNIYTYDLINKEYLLFDEKIYSINSLIFINNSLIILDKENILKLYNIKNKNIFWKKDLSKILSKNNQIIQSYIHENIILLFFSNGQILQFDKISGEIMFKQNLKLNNVNYIISYNDYFIFNQINGKTVFYKQ